MSKRDKAGRFFLDQARLNTYKGLLNTCVTSLNRKNEILEASKYKLLTSQEEVSEFNKNPEINICHQVSERCGLNTTQIDVLKVFTLAKKPSNYNDLVTKIANSDLIDKTEYIKGKWVLKSNAIEEEDFWLYYRNDEQKKAIEALEKALEQVAIVSKYINGRASFSILDQLGVLSTIDGDSFIINKERAINL